MRLRDEGRTWGALLAGAAAGLRDSPDEAKLQQTQRLLEEMIEAGRRREVPEAERAALRKQIEALRAELFRAETLSRRMAAVELEWAHAVWEAMGLAPGASYDSAGQASEAVPELRRLEWQA